nr:hypothetical protein [Tanacetum cinerariifolium]
MFDCDDYLSSESDESWPHSSLYDRFQPNYRYHVVPPSYTGTFMPPKPNLVFNTAPTAVETDHSTFTIQLSPTKPKHDLSHTNRPTTPIIEDWVSDSKDESETKAPQIVPSFVQSIEQVKSPRHSVQHVETSIPAATPKLASPTPTSNGKKRNRKTCFVCKSLDHLIKDYDYHEQKMAQPTKRNHAHRGNHKQYAPLTHKNPQKHMVPTAVLTQSKPVSITAVRPFSATVTKLKVTRPRHAKPIVTKSNSPTRRHLTHSLSPKVSNSPPRVTVVKALVASAAQGNPQHALKDKEVIDSGCLWHMTGNMSYLSDFEELNGGYVAFGVLLRVPKENDMYNVNLKNIIPSGDLTCLFAKATIDQSNLWHRRLEQINFKTINKLVKGNLVRGLPTKVFENDNSCVACKKGKQHRASCKTKHVSSVDQPLYRLYMDLFGPTFVKSMNKKSYCLVVTDDYSRFTWVFFLATKDETSLILKTFITGLENQLSLKVKLLRSDNGTEFKNNDLTQFCRMKGIKKESSLPDESQVLLRIPRENNMYNINLKNIVPSGDLTCHFAKATIDESNLWHRRLAHINFKTINKLVKGNLVRGLPIKVFKNDNTCVACKKDDYSRFTWVFFLATKDATSPILKTFITCLENQLSLKVKVIKSDNETKFKNNGLNQFCGIKGIKREFSVPRTPQQNGIAERKNRTLIEAARTMLVDLLLPIPFWAKAVNTACYVQNMVLVTKPHNKTPYEFYIVEHQVDEDFLVGYSVSGKAFKVFNNRTRIVQETLHVNFLENKPNIASSGPTWLFDIDSLTRTMSYQPVTAGNQTNPSVGFQDKFDAEKAGEEIKQQYMLFPVWSS